MSKNTEGVEDTEVEGECKEGVDKEEDDEEEAEEAEEVEEEEEDAEEEEDDHDDDDGDDDDSIDDRDERKGTLSLVLKLLLPFRPSVDEGSPLTDRKNRAAAIRRPHPHFILGIPCSRMRFCIETVGKYGLLRKFSCCVQLATLTCEGETKTRRAPQD
jgi:hypothetical protein